MSDTTTTPTTTISATTTSATATSATTNDADAATATATGIVDIHLAAYSETDSDRRDELIARAWADDGHLIDPPIDGKGHSGIAEMIAAVLGHYPGHTFRRTTGVDAHHGLARYAWELVSPAGEVALTGLDVAELGDDGKLLRVAGFLGDLPSLDA